jgi:hypothetical protein
MGKGEAQQRAWCPLQGYELKLFLPLVPLGSNSI